MPADSYSSGILASPRIVITSNWIPSFSFLRQLLKRIVDLNSDIRNQGAYDNIDLFNGAFHIREDLFWHHIDVREFEHDPRNLRLHGVWPVYIYRDSIQVQRQKPVMGGSRSLPGHTDHNSAMVLSAQKFFPASPCAFPNTSCAFLENRKEPISEICFSSLKFSAVCCATPRATMLSMSRSKAE